MTTPTLDASGAVGATFSTATHNATALPIVVSSAGDTIVVIISAEPDNTTATTVSGVANTGTAVLSWSKLVGLSGSAWNNAGTSGVQAACCEVWTAVAASAGTYNVTATLSQTIDNACIIGFGVIGVIGQDTGVTVTTTVTSVPISVTSGTSSHNDLFIVVITSSGPNNGVFPTAAPTGYTILKQEANHGGSQNNLCGAYYKTSTTGIAAATINTNDSFTSNHPGAIVFAFTSDASSVTATITTSLGGFAQVFHAALSTPVTIATHFRGLAQTFTVRDAVIAAITTQFSGLAQVLDVVPRQAGNTSFNSWWSIGP